VKPERVSNAELLREVLDWFADNRTELLRAYRDAPDPNVGEMHLGRSLDFDRAEDAIRTIARKRGVRL